MLVRIQSFAIGMAIAAVILAVGLLAYSAFAGGGDDGNDFLVSLPTRVPTAVSSAPSQQTAPTAIPVATSPPGVTAPAVTSVPAAAPTTVPAVLIDRTSCDEIRGTAYRSEAERTWFNSNCQASPTPPPATSAPGQATATPAVAATPRDAFAAAFAGLIAEYDTAAAALAAVVSAPQVADAAWRAAATSGAQALQSQGAVVAGITVPACLNQSQAALVNALTQLQLAANLTIAAVNQSDANVLLLVNQRIASARGSLAQAAQLANAAPC
jgi:hypothetical protein